MPRCFTLVVLCLFAFTARGKPTDLSLAIDFGNEWLKVCVIDPDGHLLLEIAVNDQSSRKTPTLVGFEPNGRILVGDDAESLTTRAPQRVHVNLLRLLAQQLESPEVKLYSSDYPYITKAFRPDVARSTVSLHSSELKEDLSAEELIAVFLQNMLGKLQVAGATLAQHGVKKTVLLVPDAWSTQQHDALVQAVELAGLEVTATLGHHAAAAVDYAAGGRNKGDGAVQKVLFVGVGSHGTTATLVTVDRSMATEKGRDKDRALVTVGASSFTADVGGLRMDVALRDLLARKFDEKRGKKGDPSVTGDDRAMAKLLIEARAAKEALSLGTNVEVYRENLFEGETFQFEVTPAMFDEAIASMLQSLRTPIDRVLADEGLAMADVTILELFGAASRTPAVPRALRQLYPSARVGAHIDADESAVFGAAIHSARLANIDRVAPVTLTDRKRTSGQYGRPMNDAEYEESSSTLAGFAKREAKRQAAAAARNELETRLNELSEKIDMCMPETTKGQELVDRAAEQISQARAWLEDEVTEDTEEGLFADRLADVSKTVSAALKSCGGKEDL